MTSISLASQRRHQYLVIGRDTTNFVKSHSKSNNVALMILEFSKNGWIFKHRFLENTQVMNFELFFIIILIKSCPVTYWGDTYGLCNIVVMHILKFTGYHCTKVKRKRPNVLSNEKYNIWMISSCLYLLLDFEWLLTKQYLSLPIY
jgi:hypothetical protein